MSYGDSKTVAHEFLTDVKECTQPVQAQAKPNPIMERRVEHQIVTLDTEILAGVGYWKRKSPGRPHSQGYL